MPEALHAWSAMEGALTRRPSRSHCAEWVAVWPHLDDLIGVGHAARLEGRLLDRASHADGTGFRAAWLLALLADARALRASGMSTGLHQLFHTTASAQIRRECIRALLALPHSPAVAEDLLEWACQVVFAAGEPRAALHQALVIMERHISSEVDGSMSSEMREALDHVRRSADRPHTKKKAALLLARLS